jgi:hypothetical protein
MPRIPNESKLYLRFFKCVEVKTLAVNHNVVVPMARVHVRLETPSSKIIRKGRVNRLRPMSQAIKNTAVATGVHQGGYKRSAPGRRCCHGGKLPLRSISAPISFCHATRIGRIVDCFLSRTADILVANRPVLAKGIAVIAPDNVTDGETYDQGYFTGICARSYRDKCFRDDPAQSSENISEPSENRASQNCVRA